MVVGRGTYSRKAREHRGAIKTNRVRAKVYVLRRSRELPRMRHFCNYLFSTKKRHPKGYRFLVVGRGRFELPKSVTSDLQSDPFGRSGIFPYMKLKRSLTFAWSWRLESNPQPADYKSAALPVELRQRISGKKSGALGWNRTADIRIFSPALYQLSYQGMNAARTSGKKSFGDPKRARTVDLQRDRLAL